MIEQQIYDSMRSYGIEPPDRILFNTEKVVRFGKKTLAGMYSIATK